MTQWLAADPWDYDEDWVKSADWLAVSPRPPRLRPPAPPAKVKSVKKVELAAWRRQMSLDQRRYLDTLVACRFHAGNAEKLFKSWFIDKHGKSVNRATLWRWRQSDKFVKSLDILTENALLVDGPSVSKILLRVDELADYGAEDIEQYDRSGNLVERDGKAVTAKRDPTLALKANELLGKHERIWGDDTAARVTVNIVDLTGEPPGEEDTVIEGVVVRG